MNKNRFAHENEYTDRQDVENILKLAFRSQQSFVIEICAAAAIADGYCYEYDKIPIDSLRENYWRGVVLKIKDYVKNMDVREKFISDFKKMYSSTCDLPTRQLMYKADEVLRLSDMPEMTGFFFNVYNKEEALLKKGEEH